MMAEKKKHISLTVANILLFFIIIILHSSGTVDLGIRNATPLIVLPLLTAFSCFSGLGFSALAGFLTGACLDSVTAGTYCFNTVILMLLSVTVYLLSNNVFNKNILSCTVMSFIVCAVYFVTLWLVFCLFTLKIKESIAFLFGYSLPSAVYSAVFVIPFYYLYRYFNKIKER